MEVGSIWPKSSYLSWLDSASQTGCQAWISLRSKSMPGKQSEIKHRSPSIGVLPPKMLVSNSSVSTLLLKQKSKIPVFQMKADRVLAYHLSQRHSVLYSLRRKNTCSVTRLLSRSCQ